MLEVNKEKKYSENNVSPERNTHYSHSKLSIHALIHDIHMTLKKQLMYLYLVAIKIFFIRLLRYSNAQALDGVRQQTCFTTKFWLKKTRRNLEWD